MVPFFAALKCLGELHDLECKALEGRAFESFALSEVDSIMQSCQLCSIRGQDEHPDSVIENCGVVYECGGCQGKTISSAWKDALGLHVEMQAVAPDLRMERLIVRMRRRGGAL